MVSFLYRILVLLFLSEKEYGVNCVQNNEKVLKCGGFIAF